MTERMHRTFARCSGYFYAVSGLCLCLAVRIATAGQIQPANTAVVVGTNVRLTCSAGQSITFAQWTFYPTGTTSAVIVYQGVSCIRSSTGYPLVGYSVDATNSTNGQCDLIIYTATASQAGWYTCTLTSAPPVNTVAAQVTVFASSPQCSQNVTTNIAEGDSVSMTCDASYSSQGVTAIMTWFGCPYNNVSFNSVTARNLTMTVSEIYTVAQEAQVQMCTCTTSTSSTPLQLPTFLSATGAVATSTNVPYNYTWNSTWFTVQYCPTSVVMSPSSQALLPSSVVNCSGSGYPPPIYFLTVHGPYGIQIINSSLTTLTTPGIYNITCNASSYIQSGQQGNFWCSNQSLPYVYNVTYAAITSTTIATTTTATMNKTPIYIAFGVGIGVTVLVVATVLFICCLWSRCPLYRCACKPKEKQSERTEPSLQMSLTSEEDRSRTGNSNQAREQASQPEVTRHSEYNQDGYRPYQQNNQFTLSGTGTGTHYIDRDDIMYSQLAAREDSNRTTGNGRIPPPYATTFTAN